jgi:pilus assembly protein CpaB
VARPDQDLRQVKSGTPGRSALRAVAFIGLAVLTAIGTALLLTRWVNARTATAHVPTARVVIAAADLPVGAELKPEDLAVIEWPLASRPPSAQEDPTALVKRVVATHLFKGEVVLPEKLAAPGSGSGLAALLVEGMRAVAVRVDDVVGVAGFVHPGDFVDVIVTMQENGAPTSKTILQNIKVLAVGKQTDPRQHEREKVSATVATLMVDSGDAERLALGASKGQLLLALRGAADSAVVQTAGVAPHALLGAPAAPRTEPPAPAPEPPKERARVARKAAPPPAPHAAPPPPASDPHVVEILRGDRFERRDFDKKGARP